ncbi:alpha/beta hydrolase [Enterococcus camelliae]|uniref:Alpha/beta hydrolase n=1 Tax=Enterococcus camelliae TaxID=453959 RepID=A0ABW5TH35_9ENTE
MLGHCSYFSEVLQRRKSYVVVTPEKQLGKTKVVILLHGIGSDETSWMCNAPLQDLADEYQTAFFCPSGENSFYTNQKDGPNFAKAFGEEFVEYLQQWFTFDFSRDNLQLAGFSMGGYGATLLGLRYPERFSRIGAFSPAFVFYKKERNDSLFNQVFSRGDYGSENDCVFLYKHLLESNRTIPTIQFSCGVADPLHKETKNVMEAIVEMNPKANVSFYTEDGFHDFSLWRNDLKRFLETRTNNLTGFFNEV